MKRIIFLVLALASILVWIDFVSIEGDTRNLNANRPENPIERQKWRLMQKGGHIDPARLKTLRNDLKAMVDIQGKSHKRDAGLAKWEFRGPDNIGGRVRAIAIHPNDPDLIYVGSAGGGMWRSANGGGDWELVDDFLPSLAITCIIFNPRDPDIMYASTGEGLAPVIGMPGAGIYRSDDMGLSWTLLPSTENFNWVNKIAIHPQDTGVLFAATALGSPDSPNSGRFYKSSNSGAFWIEQIGSGIVWTDIDIHPLDPNLITVSGNSGYMRSVNGGTSFTYELGDLDGLPTGGRRIEIAMWEGDPRHMYALMHIDSTNVSNPNRCKLFYSDDGGDTWDPRFQDVNSVFGSNGFGDYSNTIWVDPLNAKHVLFGGVDLWESTDEGFTANPLTDWTHYHNRENNDSFSLHADHHIIVAAPDYDNSNQMVYFGNDGGIQRTKNLSTATVYSGWENLLNKQIGITQFYSGAVAPDESVFGGGAQDNSFSTGLGNATSWRQPITGDGAYMAINYDDPNIIYANTNYNTLWKSTDKGSTWEAATYLPAPPNPLQYPVSLESYGANLISPIIMDPDDPDILYMGAEQLWKYDADNLQLDSIKNGTSSGTTVTAIAAASNGNLIWVGYSDGVIQFSTSAGNAWSSNIAPGPLAFVTDIDIKADLSQVIVSLAGYNQTNVWKYRVSNGTWTNISLGVDLQVNCVTHNPLISNWIYAGTDLGVFSSEDNGNTWSSTPLYGPPGTALGNDGPIFTEVTELFWSGTISGSVAPLAKLWASTFGRGLWSSNWVLGKIHIDRINGSDVTGTGTFINPYKTLERASMEAGSGSTIVFVRGTNHEESPTPSILLDKRVKFELQNGAVIIK